MVEWPRSHERTAGLLNLAVTKARAVAGHGDRQLPPKPALGRASDEAGGFEPIDALRQRPSAPEGIAAHARKPFDRVLRVGGRRLTQGLSKPCVLHLVVR